MTKEKDPQLEHRRQIWELVAGLDFDKFKDQPTRIIRTRVFYGEAKDLKPESKVDIIILTDAKPDEQKDDLETWADNGN